MQGVVIHDALTEYADSLGVGSGFEALYQEVLGYLSGMFGVSEDSAKEISRIPDDLEYTMALLDIVDPSWRDEIQPTVELTEGGASMPEYTGEPPVEEAPEDAGSEPETYEEPSPEEYAEGGDEGAPSDEGGAPDEAAPSEGGEENPDGGSGDGGFTLTPDADTEITNSDGTHVEISNPETNTGGGTDDYTAPSGGTERTDPGDQNTASDGTTLYSFNVKKGPDGRYHQTN